MAKNIFQVAKDFFAGKNKFNEAFYRFLGGGFTNYNQNAPSYLDNGYNRNPDVYACISQMANKTVSVPYMIKMKGAEHKYQKLKSFNLATKGNLSILQSITKQKLEKEAYQEHEMPFPLDVPNSTQSWSDIWALYKIYMKITGNFYLYILAPKEGENKGVPVQVFALPAHLIEIVLKDKADMMGIDSPIDHYRLIEGNITIKLEAEDVIHIKYANPNFDQSGEHLYGMSPLKSALRNINSQNSAIDNNIKTLQNSGAFGFIFGKNAPLTQPQADSLKERLVEMDNSPERLSRIAGASSEIGFQRMSLTTDELKPFDYLNWDRKSICNVLGWYDELLNNDSKGGIGASDTTQEQKLAITNNILPDLVLLADTLNKSFIPRFKGYETAVIEWDVSELPEMQTDMKLMTEWLNMAPITPNEFRTALKYETLEDDGMDVVWLNSGKTRIDDVSEGVFNAANNNQNL